MKRLRSSLLVLAGTLLFTLPSGDSHGAERRDPVVRFHLSYEDTSFFADELIAQTGKKPLDERHIDFPAGRFGRGIRMNFIPVMPDSMATSLTGTDLDMTTNLIFNVCRRVDNLGFNSPFFHGTGRLDARYGAVAFWVKGSPPLPATFFEQTSAAFGRLERDLIGVGLDCGGRLTAYLRDARYVRHEIAAEASWDGGRWNHVVLNWDRANGLELWLNGEVAASSWGKDQWFETLPPGIFRTPAPTVVYDELRIMDRPLTDAEIRRLMTSNEAPGPEPSAVERSPVESERLARSSGAVWSERLPAASPGERTVFTEVRPLFAGDGNIPGWYVIDGRNEMAWPHEYAFFTIIIGDADFHAEKVDLTTTPESLVNYVALTGNLTNVGMEAGLGGMEDTDTLFEAPEGDGFMFASTVAAPRGATFRIPFTERYGTPPGFSGDIRLPISGDKRIHEVGLYRVEKSAETGPPGKPLAIAPFDGALDERWEFSFHSLASRDERTLALASAGNGKPAGEVVEIGAFRRLNIMSEPYGDPTGVTSLSLSLPLKTERPEETLFVRVHDPAAPSRLWNQFALKLEGFDRDFGTLLLTVDCTDLVLTGGDRLWIDLATAGPARVRLGDESRPASLYVGETPFTLVADDWAEKELVAGQAQYSKMYEFMPWLATGRTVSIDKPYAFGGAFDILYPALAVRRVRKDNLIADFLYLYGTNFYDQHGVPADRGAFPLKTVADTRGAPEWAAYMRDYNRNRWRIVDWIAEHQNPDGQIGGGWNDDSLIISYHMPDIPLDGHDGARSVVDLVHRSFEETRIFRDGYCHVRPMDRFHTGDFIIARYSTVLYNLGDPYPAERSMEAARHYGRPELTPVNYGEGEAFVNAVNVLRWYWGEDMPDKPYRSRPVDQVTARLRRMASYLDEYAIHRFTDAYVHRDDNSPFGSFEMLGYLLGSNGFNRRDTHVDIAVAWPSGGGPDVARLVLEADDESLRALCYSFHDRTRGLAMRLCRIRHGRYRVSLFADTTGSGHTGELLWRAESALRRFDTVTVPVPPRTPVIIAVERLEGFDEPEKLPDPAVGVRDIERNGSLVTVTVHNLGDAPAEGIVVRLVDGEETLAEKTIGRIDAPTDYTAKKAAVSFIDVPDRRTIRAVLDPDDALTEILEENNEAAVPCRMQ